MEGGEAGLRRGILTSLGGGQGQPGLSTNQPPLFFALLLNICPILSELSNLRGDYRAQL